MMLRQNEQRLREAIEWARQTRTLLTSRGGDWQVDLNGAYRVQATRLSAVSLKGYKLGLLSPAKQQQMGIDHPIYGRITTEMLQESPLSLGQFLQPRMEPELVVWLRAPIPPSSTPDQAEQAIGGIFLGLDVLDSVWKDYRFSVVEVVADNASGGGFLMGTQLLSAWPRAGTLRLFLDGVCVGEGEVAVLGDPGERLQWLARQVGGLQAGQFIFMGSPTSAQPARPGVLRVELDNYLLLCQLTP
ncbi:MAG: fumarylacetoacetate hydrolase family protein [Rhodothermus sp.]|nr:fumarylacetoacetate hydrolase family protein [Rhodothermus sp.]